MIPRAAIVVCGLLGLGLPLPTGGILVVTVLGVIALGYSVARPGSSGPAVVIAASVLTWLATRGGAMHDVRLVALALAISVLHASAALAAVVPRHARVPARLALRWAGWAALAAAVGAGALAAASLLPAGDAALPITVFAVAAAALGAAVLVALADRVVRR
jgi:hypothetical protein